MPSEENNMPTYIAVLMEDFHSKIDTVIEHMDGVEMRLTRRFDEKLDRLGQNLCDRMDVKFAQQDRRFDAIESILEIHSLELKDHSQRLSRIEAAAGHMR